MNSIFHILCRSVVLVCIPMVVVFATVGCELEGIESDAANFITFNGIAPDGEPLGISPTTIPMVDSTITFRVLVADTQNTRAGQGLPTGLADARVAWTVSDGTVDPAISTLGDFGIAETRWTLGTDASSQTITARLVGDGVPDQAVTTSLSAGGTSYAAIFPGPPVILDLDPSQLALQVGASTALRVRALRDEYGNVWDLAFFEFTLTSSDTTLAQPTGLSTQGEAAVRGLGPGEATLTVAAQGRVGNAYDLRSLVIATNVPVAVAAFEGFAARFEDVSAGDGFVCAVAADGTPAAAGAVYCWGSVAGGRLGLPSLMAPMLPTPRPELTVEGLPQGATVRTLASGRAHTCAALDDGSVYCWGANEARQLGSFANMPGANRALLDNPNAASVAEAGFVDLAAGASHTCALGESGAVYCWGNNSQGQLGNGQTGQSQILSQRVQGLDGVQVVALAQAGPLANHMCALADVGDLYCWGAGESGQLGDGSQQRRPRADLVSGNLSFVSASTSSSLSGTESYTCGVTQTGELYCWGRPPGTSGGTATPAEVTGGAGARYGSVHTGPEHACVLDQDGAAYCFGTAQDGRLGNGIIDPSLLTAVPEPVRGDRSYALLAPGRSFNVALEPTGNALSWGDNGVGQLGITSDEAAKGIPTDVVFSTEAQ